jgi:exodeoxyribonuclease-3
MQNTISVTLRSRLSMKKLKIMSWNVNGLRAVYKKGFVGWILETGPDILCIQETKAREEQLPDELINIKGYESHHVSAQKKR